ncbi:hypothetical protein [Kitasatospora camelliae]|uniref:Ig-like domain-containing protein n=1 Tax=Kitasatospora camelliae TaxID=3156397 RepID=A0AAU8K2K6_9ACTN
MAASVAIPKPGPVVFGSRVTVGLVEVTLPASSPQLTYTWIDERTMIVGYNPSVLDGTLVSLWLDTTIPAGYQLVAGVPA